MSAEATAGDQVGLSWQSGNSPPASGEHYELVRDGVTVAATDKTTFTDTWLEASHTYVYAIRALDGAGDSATSPTATVTTPAAEPLFLAPYLLDLQSRSVTIGWHSDELVTTGLRLGAEGAPLAVAKRDLTPTTTHVVRLSGLSPETTYRYQYESDGALGPVTSFRTSPPAAARFLFGAIGDFGNGSAAEYANLRRMRADRIDFALTTGDNAYPFGGINEYKRYLFTPLADFMNSKPFWPTVGNHDYYGLANYKRFFADLLPGKGLYYDFSYGGALFVSLDSTHFDPAQRSWLRRRLASSGARCKIAVFHHPIWSSGKGYRHGRGRALRRRQFVPILQRGGVDLVLNGHVHNYERSKPLRAGRVSRRRGIVYVVTGGGGGKLGGFETRRKPKWSARRGVFFHRMRFTVAGKRITGVAVDSRGRVRDRFGLSCR